jgi:hypothetical protein
MKLLKHIAILLSLSVFAATVYADIPLESDKDILGSWKLDGTKKSSKSTDIIEREDTWTFDNGTVTITNIPREGGHYDQAPVKYVIEEGKLKISILGRMGRFDEFSLLEKGDNTMALRAKFGTIYLFSRK